MTYSPVSNRRRESRKALVKRGLASWWTPKLSIDELCARLRL